VSIVVSGATLAATATGARNSPQFTAQKSVTHPSQPLNLAENLNTSQLGNNMNTIEELHQQVNDLQQDLEQKDLLVKQLSEELFRLVKGNAAFTPSLEMSEQHQETMQRLSEKLANVEEQLATSQAALQERDREIIEMRKSIEELSDRNRMLEQVVQELPNVYRAKFAERMIPIKAKVEMLQKENRQLHIELQSLSYRLATRNRPQRVELPKTQIDLPMFS